MDRHFAHNWVKLFQLKALSGVLLIFCGNITRHPGQTTFLLLSAFEDNLYSVAFFCHLYRAFLHKLANRGGDTIFIDGTYRRGTHFEGDPPVFIRQKETLRFKIRVELPFSLGI